MMALYKLFYLLPTSSLSAGLYDHHRSHTRVSQYLASNDKPAAATIHFVSSKSVNEYVTTEHNNHCFRPLYRSTCVSRHLQLKTGGFC